MASRIGGYAADNRAQILPTLWLAAGLLLLPVSGAGWSWMLFAKTAAISGPHRVSDPADSSACGVRQDVAPTQDPVLAEQIGWPEFVATVEGVVVAPPSTLWGSLRTIS
jgi:hypothetical protein